MPSRMPTPDRDGAVRNGVAPLWYLHLRRLARSCRALGVPLPGELPTPRAAGTGCTGWWSAPAGSRSASARSVSTEPVSLALARGAAPAVPAQDDRAGRSSTVRSPRPGGRGGRRAAAHEGGYVAECAIWSVFWWEGGLLCAPGARAGDPAGRGPGPDRRAGGRSGRAAGARWGRSRAGALFVANAVRGVVPVAQLFRVIRCRKTAGTSRLSRLVLALTEAPGPGSFCGLVTGRWLPAVVVAQSVRAPDCGSGGCGFNPRQPPWAR